MQIKDIAAFFLLSIILRLTIRPLMDKYGISKALGEWKTDWVTGIGMSVCVIALIWIAMLMAVKILS